MALPAYKRPFDADDFRGYFTWSSELTSKLSSDSLYHACHLNEARHFLKENLVDLRSEWSLILPSGKRWTCPGTWCGLNYFHNGNRYGPILFEFPLRVLNGRTFMVFRRTGDRNRYFFVQYEAGIPIFEFQGRLWRKVRAAAYFDKWTRGNGLSLKRSAIYDIVITTPLKLKHASVRGVRHPECISRKCSGSTGKQSDDAVRRLGLAELKRTVFASESYRNFARRFPDMIETEATLPQSEPGQLQP